MPRRLLQLMQALYVSQFALRVFCSILLVSGFFLTGCAGDRESSANAFFPTENAVEQGAEYGDDVSYWDDTRSGGKPKIVIDLNEQRAYFYRGNRMVGVSIVSTGREGYDTPSGEFRVTEKDPAHISSVYGDYVDRSGQVVMENVDVTKDKRPPGTVFRGAPMPYFLRIHGSIGIHAGYLPGYPASHGCIRLPKVMAVRFYENAAVGTPVVVRRDTLQEYAPNPDADDRDEPSNSIY